MKSRKIQKRTAMILVFLLLLSGMLWWLNRVLIIKRVDGILTIQNLYEQEPDTCDILVLGSSHVGMNLDAEVFWKEQGYASYVLWGSVQPFWNSYFYLLEALEYQSPQLVILDVFAAANNYEYADDMRQQTNISGMRMSRNKLHAIYVSAPPENRMNLFLQFPLYHARIRELTADDFQHFPWSDGLTAFKGTSYRYGSNCPPLEDPSFITDVEPMHPKQEVYLRKIIELCAMENIPLILIKTPMTIDRLESQKYYNYVQTIAQEYGVPFLNMNLMDTELGLCSADVSLDGAHLNTIGSRKITSWLGTYIHNHYAIPDRRGDARYSSWDVFSQDIQKGYLRCVNDPTDYFAEIVRAEYPAIFIQNNTAEGTQCETAMRSAISASDIQIKPWDAEMLNCSVFAIEPTSALLLEQQENTEGAQGFWFSHNGTDYYLEVKAETYIYLFKDDDLIFSLIGSGTVLVVFDPHDETCLDIVSFDETANPVLTHHSAA